MPKYAVVNESSGIVESIAVWDGVSEWSPGDGYIAIQSDDVEIGWTYADGELSAPTAPVTPERPDEELSISARAQRDQLLRSVYDPGILIAQRYLRMATTPEEIEAAELKIIELDNYAEALEDVPDQEGFPQVIDWPIAPTK